MRFGRTVAGCIIASIAAYVVMTSCASVPVEDVPNSGTVKLTVDNGLLDEAAVYVNGGFIGRVDGEHTKDFRLRDSQLVRGQCVTVVIKTMWVAGSSDEQCIRGGGRFGVKITNRYVWLTPWDR